MPIDTENLLAAARRAHEAGDLSGAIGAYQAALQVQPDDPKTLFFLGNVLMQAGQTQAALPHLEAAAARQRNHPAVLASVAQAYVELERGSDAESLYRKALRLDPGDADLQTGLATALALQRKFADAETLLKRVLARDANAAHAWLNLGNVARDQGRFEEALAHYREALRRDAQLLDARNNMGSVQQTLLRFEDAEKTYRACLAIDAGFMLARVNLASVLIDLGRFAEAETLSHDLLEATPAFADAHAMYAAAVSLQGRLCEALPHLQQAAALSPQTARHRSAYATALCELEQVEQGLQELSPLLRNDADLLATTQLVAPILLANGFFAEGWSRYRQRQTFLRIQSKFARLNLQQALPPDVQGKHIGVICEQGLGDELYFLRFAPQLKARGARITYCTSPKLGSLLGRVAALDRVITDVDAMPATDMNILVGDLPYALCEAPGFTPDAHSREATLLTAFPWTHAPYAPLPPPSIAIAPLADALGAMRARLAQAGSPPYLALTWRGGTAPEQQRGVEWKLFKEIPIPKLAQALRGWPGTLLALQRLPAAGELDALQTALDRPLADFTAVNDDLEQMLALLNVIDEYVGVSNTNMHLRAAAGKPVRVLVPCPAEWRWMAAGASPWFPGSSVYRQTPDGRWDDALNTLHSDLKA
ncbi:MAG: tetratricopeptide repeat protein [Betaproteobacteria bacterium]|nr:tetratricopeptide repeat protein [Betaproteobacteria bacterium]